MKNFIVSFLASVTLSCSAQESVSFFGSNTKFSSSLFENQLVGINEKVLVKANLYLPKKSTLTPAVIILHGSSGISSDRELYYAEELKRLGYVVLVIDSFETRQNIPRERVSVLSQTADAVAGLNYLASMPIVDKDKIITLGFSMGGHASYYLSDKSIFENFKSYNSFKGHVNFYHNCHVTFEDHNPTPAKVLSVLGDQDEYINIRECETEFARKKSKGGNAQIYIIKGAAHAWELSVPKHFESRAINRKNCLLSIKPNGALIWKTGESLSNKNYMDCETKGYTVGFDPRAKKEAENILYNFLKEEIN